MKQIAASLLATVLVIPTLAETTSLVDYGQITTSPPLELLWEFDRDTFNGVPCATITGVSVVTGEKNLTGDISVPESLVCADGTALVVKKIADGAFSSQIGITSISIPVTVEEIGSGVFTGCTVLGAISVDSGNSRFTSSNGVLYDKDLTRIIACPARKETLHLPMTLKEIGVEAFADCHRLLSLNIPSSATAIADRAFMDCTRLASVTFEGNAPTAADSIAQGANAGLVFYKKPESTGWDAVPWNSFNVQNAATEQPSGVTSATSGNVTWYYRVVTEGAESYAEIYNNDNEAIPKTTVQTYTYDPINFEWIPDGKLVIPSSLGGYTVKKIGDYAFSNCSALDSVSIPKSVRKIGNYAFAGCSSITSMEIPSEVKGIGYHPFSGTALTSLVLPDSLRDVDGNPLAGCDTFLSVSISPDNSYFTVVNGLLYDKDIQTLIGCPARMESVSIPSSTTVIGQEAFDGCFRLRTILLPDYLDSVGESAFRDATRLSSLVFPGLLRELKGPGLFENCSKLAFVGFTGNAPTVNPQLFSGAPASLIVYVAQGTTGWKDATTALPDSGKWPTDDGYGRAISNLDVSAEAELKEGDIFVGITTNGTTHYTYTLEVLANKGVKILGVSPKPVGNFEVPSAFDSSLGTLTVKTLGDRLFANSIGLLSVTIPNSVTAIGDEVFKDCNVLASVTLAHGLRAIGRHPFDGTAIETIALPDTVSTIDGNVFFGCDPSVSLSVGDNNPYFAESTEGALYDKDFGNLYAVPMTAEALVVPSTTTNIAAEAFANCIRLKAIAFLGNAPTAADDIFADTPATLKITVEEDSLGWDGDPASSALPASGLWRNRTITANAEPPIVDSNTDGTWKWTVNAGVATLYNGGSSALLDTNYNGAVSVPAEVTDSATGNKYTVVALGDRALYGCRYVTAVTLPSTIETIGVEPFAGTKVPTLAVPAYVEAIDGNPAAGCSRFTGFTVDEGNINFSADEAGCLYDHSKTTLLAVPPRSAEITVPATVTSIAGDAFAGCAILKKTTFLGDAPAAADTIFADTPAAMTSYAKENAGFTSGTWKGRQIVIVGGIDITNIIISETNTVGDIDYEMFWTYELHTNSTPLTATLKKLENAVGDVTIKNIVFVDGNLYTVTNIAAGAIADNPALLSATVPNTILEIGDEAFRNCTSLENVTLTYGIRYIGARVFLNTIVRELAVPDSLLDMRGNISAGTLFTLTLNIDDSSHFVYSDDGALFNRDMTKLYACPTRAEGTIILPETLTNICTDAFFGCHRLTYLNIPASVTTIGDGAFNVAGIWPGLSAPESTPKLLSVFYNGSVPDAADDIYDGAPTGLVSYVFSEDWIDPWKGRKVTKITATNPPVLKFKDSYGLTWYYRIVNGEAELYNDGEAVIDPTYTDSNRSSVTRGDNLLLPSSINGYVVTKIGDYAFLNCKNLSRIDIPPSITTIGDYAFKGCAAISRIRGTDSFGEDATIEIPDNITTLGYHPFEDLKSVAVIIPRTTIEIEGNPLAGMPFIAAVEVDENNPKFVSSDNVIYNKQSTEVVAVPANYSSSSIHFLNSARKINSEALYGCENLRSILLPDSLEYIGTNAFTKCTGISALTIPASVIEIGHSPFTNCTALLKVTYDGDAPATDNTLYAGTQTNLTSFVLDTATGFSPVLWEDRPIVVISTSPDSTILHYDDGAITWYFRVNDDVAEIYRDDGNPAVVSDDPNSPILSISLPQTLGGYIVKGVGDGALANLRGITSISIPDTYEWIGDNAFSNCTSLASIDIPYGVRYIGARAFVNTIIREIKVPDSLLDMGGNISAGTLFTSTISIDDSSHFKYSDDGVLYNRDMTKLYVCPTRAEGTVTIPNTVTNIAADAFFGCHRLTYLNIPASVTTIGDGAFNVAGIWPDLSAPESTPHLESIFYNGTKPNATDDIYAGTPDTLVSYALTDNGWTDGETWKDRKVMVISGEDPPVLDYTDSNGITWKFKIINNNVTITGIEPKSTRGVPNVDVDVNDMRYTLEIPTVIRGFTVTSIGPSAFSDCTSLTYVGIPSSIQEIGDFAFSNCTAIIDICGLGFLTTTQDKGVIELPSGITRLGKHPFEGVPASTISLPYTLLETDGNPLAGCDFLTTVTIDGSCPNFSVAENILYDKQGKILVGAPANLEESSVAVPSAVTTIGNEAFAGCKNLESILLPESLEYIGTNAFNGCTALSNLKFLGNAPAAADDIFADTPATMKITVLDGSLGWDGDPTSSALPASGLWRNRKIELAPGEADKYTDSDGTVWDVTVYDNKAELGANGATPIIPASTSGEVTVPGEITIDGKTYTITSIPDGAFEGCSEITAINIPASTTSIAADAFNGCTSLESFSVGSKNPAYSSRNGILYSKDGKTLVKVPAKTSFAATFTEKETASKKEIVEVIGSTDPDTMTTEPNQIIELKSYGTSTSTTATEFSPSLSIDMILSGVTAISDYAFTDCGLMPEGSTVTGTLVVKVDGKETERKTGTFTLPVGTDSTGGHSYSYIYSQAGFYKGSVCLYHTASDSYKTISYAIPISIPTGISYSNLAFYNSHFTSKNKPDTPVPAPPVVVVNPPVDVPDDDSGDTNDGFGVTAILRDSNGNESAIKEGEVIEAHVGIKMSIPLSVGNAPDGSLSTVTAKGLPAGVKLAKTAVKEGRKVVKYIYAIEGTPSRAQSAKTVVLKVTNKKNKLNESVSFAIKVLAMPSWVGGKYNGVCFDGTTEIGSATASISAAGKLSGKIMVPSDDGKKALKLSFTAKGFSGFDEESNTFYGTATMRVNKQTIDVPFALSAYNGAGQLSLELPGMTAALEQNTWKRGDIVATTIEVDGLKFKLSANGKVKWSGSVEGDNGRMLSVSGSTQLLSGPSVLVYIPPKSNLVGGRCELFQLQ